jgi:hypothetical protein
MLNGLEVVGRGTLLPSSHSILPDLSAVATIVNSGNVYD